MPPIVPAGPYEQIDLGGGKSAPLYLIPFDKSGVCTGPASRAALLEDAKRGGYSDIFLFSHGWNNDWPTATGRYRGFFDEFRKAREGDTGQGNLPTDYKPLLIGIFWPSTALVFGEEKGPDIAAGGAGVPTEDAQNARDGQVGQEVETLEWLAAQLELTAEDRRRFYELMAAESSTPAEAKELAALFLPLYQGSEDEADPAGSSADFEAQDLVQLWQGIPLDPTESTPSDDDEDDDSFGMGGGVTAVSAGAAGAADGSPQAAGLIGSIIGLPRKAVRGATVWKMKDRAGTVGASGVASLLRDLLAASASSGRPARSHLIGHSYGCKVVLSAICGGAAPLADGAVDSLLLLQPAVNFWCFAANVDGLGFSGGYRDALRAVRQPILMSWSKKDVALHRLFHLAVTRKKKDLGEVQIAGPLEPNRYGGLGGWGPRGCSAAECEVLTLPKAGQPYPNLGPGAPQLYALDGGNNGTVNGHGDVVTPHTAWALLQQVKQGLLS